MLIHFPSLQKPTPSNIPHPGMISELCSIQSLPAPPCPPSLQTIVFLTFYIWHFLTFVNVSTTTFFNVENDLVNWLQGSTLKKLFQLLHVNSWLWHVGTSSLTRDQTHVPCVGNAVLATGPPGKSPLMLLLIFTVAPNSSPCLFFGTIYLLGPLQLIHCCRRSSGWTAPSCVSSAAVPSRRWRPSSPSCLSLTQGLHLKLLSLLCSGHAEVPPAQENFP